ncbi:transglutaminase family protein [Rhodocytophaga aerolata]|uniref:Transglutaminase family protein n=1 Tax=Rhodocytophaga aerolata TaxID=455078 RepID=A0ABT8R7E0_9BACT|nr:transglutaminase family protein [Rhodocytophaga aerolata]MDO1448023.1 transglutaminase family protein [Rhodocytophaga aerolata]
MTAEYLIEYYTRNVYESPVTEALFEFIVTPASDSAQQLKEIKYGCSLPGQLFHHTNPFGFVATNLRTIKPFTEFEFSMIARVEKTYIAPKTYQPLSPEEELFLLASRVFIIDHYHFLEFTKYTTIIDEHANWIVYKQRRQPVFDFLQELNQYIYSRLEFDPEPTNVHTTASEVINLGKGVCQDYTHLFLAIARKNRIPCRYVSGYLNQGGNLTGAAVMHAWAEAFIPGLGWCGFDPTNNLLVDNNYIKAAYGTDYSDCSPMKGVLKTTGNHHTDYQVKVTQQATEPGSQQ